MRIFRSFEEAGHIPNPVVTTGSFDGVHIGHKSIIDRLNKLSERYNGESVLITFHPHPRKVLYPETAGKKLRFINSEEEKLELLRKTGLRNVIIIEFTREFSKTTSEEFVRDYLHGMLRAKVVVVGFNHHFGFHQEGDYRQLWSLRNKYDFDAEEIPGQEVRNETVSSTKIRLAISEGNIQRANAYLDHYYIIMGKPIEYNSGNGAGQYPLVLMPVTEECKLLPAPGIYAATFESGSLGSKALVIIHGDKIGNKPEVLIHPLGNNSGIYNVDGLLSFHKKLYGPVNLTDPDVSGPQIRQALNETEELIY